MQGREAGARFHAAATQEQLMSTAGRAGNVDEINLPRSWIQAQGKQAAAGQLAQHQTRGAICRPEGDGTSTEVQAVHSTVAGETPVRTTAHVQAL